MVSYRVRQNSAMPSTTVSLVVTDLDGTLWHTDDLVHEPVRSAFVEIQARELPLLVATGRRLGTTLGPLNAHGLSAPVVVLNGALGVLPDGTRFHRAPYPDDEAAVVLEAFLAVDLDPVVYVDHPDHEVVLGPSPSTNPLHVRALEPSARRVDTREAIGTDTVLGFSLIGVEHEVGAMAAASIGGSGVTHLDRSLDHPGMVSLTVAPTRRSKWDGVLAYCDRFGLDPDAVLALGDGPNDVELLDGAAVALVPEGSHPEALQRADHLIGAAHDGGWADVLDHLG